jgi:hypothetical protein
MLLVVAGCGSLKPGGVGVKERDVSTNAPPPDAARLVAYLNDNARRAQAVECDKVSIDCKQGDQSIGLDGLMACQKPRNFRLKLKALGKPGADIGSNDQEFWFWISKTEPVPYVFHCSYDDLARTKVEMPFPFQPEMIMSAMGIAEYDPNKNYEVRPNGPTLELIEQAMSPAGQPITKLTVFNRQAVPVGKPQVIAHVIRDKNNQDVCVATVQEVTIDRATGALLPQRVKIVWPGKTQAERAEMTMRFYDMHATSFDQARAGRLFGRQDLVGQQSYDLARRAPDAPGGVSQTQAVDIGPPRMR